MKRKTNVTATYFVLILYVFIINLRYSQSGAKFENLMHFNYDLVVIGGGSGGLACAKEASNFNKSILVLDYVLPSPRGTTWGVGGTCVNAGCIPKKLMHRAALIKKDIQDAETFGWSTTQLANNITHNWSKLVENISSYLMSVRFKLKRDLKARNINFINALGSFVDEKTVRVTIPKWDKKTGEMTLEEIGHVRGKYTVIAVGGRPSYPQSPAELQKYAITSDDLFYKKTPPGKTLVIGAGYIALECAGLLSGLGYPVTVAVRDSLLKRLDKDMMNLVKDYMVQEGTKFCMGCDIQSVQLIQSDGEIQETLYNVTFLHRKTGIEEVDVFNTILCATGREPVSKFLELEKANVKFSPDDGTIVILHDQTTNEHVFAIGDVIQDSPELTPFAVQSAQLLARRLFGNSKRILQDSIDIGTVMFTPLEYASIGYTESDALQQLGGSSAIEVHHGYFYPLEWEMPRAKQGGENSKCYIKVISLLKNGRVVGIHFTGPNAGDILQGFAAAMTKQLTVRQLEDTFGIHPTTAEELTRLSITKRSGKSPKQQACCSK